MTSKTGRHGLPVHSRLLVVVALILLAAQPGLAQTTISFMFWGAPGESDLWFEMVERFNEKQNGIKVEPLHTPQGYEEKLVTLIAGGVTPDVVLVEEEPYITFARAGAFLDLTDRFERDLDPREYNQVALRFQNVDGRYYALPWDIGLGIMFHNTTLLDEAGLSLPPVDLTWDEFLENALKLTRDRNGDGRIDQWGTMVAPGFRGTSIYFIWGSGGDLVDDPANPTRVTVTESAALRGLQFITDLVHRYNVAPAPGTPQPNFVRGNLGMLRNGTWAFAQYRTSITDFNWDVTYWPRHSDVPQSGGYLGPDNIAIGSTTQHPDEAWEFVKFVIGPEGQEILGRGGRSIPALNDAARRFFIDPTVPPRNAEAIVLGAEGYGRLVPRIYNFRQMEEEWTVENRAMLTGQQSPEQTALRIKEITERYLRESQ